MERTSDYSYDLPAEQIAQRPADRRDASRLMVVGSEVVDAQFAELAGFLPDDAVLVVNDTQVIAARLNARKPTGGAVELFAVEPVTGVDDRLWRCLARASKPMRVGQILDVDTPGDETITAEVVTDRDARGHITARFSKPVLEVCRLAGDIPLPPYIHREGGALEADRNRYQTVFAEHPGAVAAPTAGLHFTDELIETIGKRGIEVARLTLHVGPGTFSPLREGPLEGQELHVERYEVPASTAELASSGRPVVAVGTTSVRALEAAADDVGRVRAGPAETKLFIRPGYRFRVVDHMVTNFHLPESSLLVLVSAFAGYQRIMSAYRHAVSSGYRFYSYGDAMLLTREDLL